MIKSKNNKIIFVVIGILFTLVSVSCTSRENNNGKSETSYKLGTVIKIKVYDSNAEKLLKESLHIIDDIERKMSSHLDNSEINQINQAAGEKAIEVSSDTYQVIKKAVEYAELSKSFFDPTIGPLVELWGIGTKQEHIPAKEEINEKLNLINYKNVKLLADNKVFLAKKRMKLDVGGIAKGYAADKVISYLKKKNVKSAFIDIGGNVSVLDRKPNGDLWTVGIQSPRKNRGEVLAAVKIKDKTVVTSGNYERYFIQNGTRYHHLLNPKTGYPAKKGIISATIITEKSFDADALSTAVYILGLKQGLDLINNLEDVEGIIVTDDNKVHITSNLKKKVKILDKSNYQLLNK